MRFVFAYAGIPSGDAYDFIQKKQATLASGNTEAFFVAQGQRGTPFSERHTKKILSQFSQLAQHHIDKSSGFSTTGYAVIYVRSSNDNSAWLEDTFFPSTLTVPVDWEQSGQTPDERAKSHKELLERLFRASVRARVAIEVLHKELKEQSNKTPLLLPPRNFQSRILKSTLKNLQSRLLTATEQPIAQSILKQVVAEFEVHHPRNPVDNVRLRTFRDDRDIEFRSPGKAKHGVPDFGTKHPTDACILGGLRRLGAPFHAAFHYDAQKNSPKNLKGRFCMCHGAVEDMEGDPHLNVAPNDFIRA